MIMHAVVAAFAIAYHGEKTAYRDASAFVMPKSVMTIEAIDGPAGEYRLKTDAGTAVQRAPRKWQWTAPERPGDYKITFEGPEVEHGKHTITLHAFVMVPASEVKQGLLNGYRIGEYPSKPLNGNPLYLPPPGFVEVTKENQDTKLSPHFTLKQFLCKEDTSKAFPKYVVLKERLPLKLESVLALVNELGFKTVTLHVMSAYRTPFYNHAIGDVKYSMHQWGSAADIFIDPQNKGQMLDLTRDGRIDTDDSRFLYDEIEKMLADRPFALFQGGMGYYPGTRAHPPFVHVDVRGTPARWKG
jgi:hypothetical protein